MKKTITLLLTFAATTITSAQTPEKVLARVHYTYINKNDTLKNGKAHTENILLFIGKNASLYTSYDRLNHQLALDQKVRAKFMTMIDDGKPKTITIDESSSKWMSTTNHLYFIKENKHYLKETISDQSYLVEETMPSINWKITKDTLSFSGLNCQKATTNYDGKNWIAWFAPNLPFQSGPWQLNGLPGLIIDVYDELKNIHFQFAGMENLNEGDFKRLNDITKSPSASPGDINTIDLMLGFDVADAYYANMIKLSAIYTTKTTKAQLEKFKIAVEKDQRGISKTQSKY
ncbi:MAG: GLPGLI family protein [Bacteroidota bacterium]